jgi:hypothetical protein
VADDSFPPDLLRDIEEVFASADPDLELASKAFEKLPLPKMGSLIELPSDEFSPANIRGLNRREMRCLKRVDRRLAFEQALVDAEAEWDEASRIRRGLRVFSALCFGASLFLYFLGLGIRGQGAEYQPASAHLLWMFVSGTFLFAMYAEELISRTLRYGRAYWAVGGSTSWLGRTFLRFKNWRWLHTVCHCRKCRRLPRTHQSFCRCWHCKLARRWTFWRRGKRYRP